VAAPTPSHFGSYRKSPTGTSGTALASIGATGGMTGKSTPSSNQGLAGEVVADADVLDVAYCEEHIYLGS
jgi:hypothetical protein